MSQYDDYLKYIKGINDNFYDQIKVADQKATYIMTIIVFLLAWSPDVRRLFFWRDATAEWSLIFAVSMALVIALVAALLCAVAVIIPRRRRGPTTMFWGAWPQARESALRLLSTDDAQAIALSYVDNAENLAAICRVKYRFVTAAFSALIVALLARAALLAIS